MVIAAASPTVLPNCMNQPVTFGTCRETTWRAGRTVSRSTSEHSATLIVAVPVLVGLILKVATPLELVFALRTLPPGSVSRAVLPASTLRTVSLTVVTSPLRTFSPLGVESVQVSCATAWGFTAPTGTAGGAAGGGVTVTVHVSGGEQ